MSKIKLESATHLITVVDYLEIEMYLNKMQKQIDAHEERLDELADHTKYDRGGKSKKKPERIRVSAKTQSSEPVSDLGLRWARGYKVKPEDVGKRLDEITIRPGDLGG